MALVNIERFACNGGFSHYDLLDVESGEVVFTEIPAQFIEDIRLEPDLHKGKSVRYLGNDKNEVGTIMYWSELGCMIDYGYNRCLTPFHLLNFI